MPREPEEKVVGQQVGPGHKKGEAGCNETKDVEHKPAPVTFVVALQRIAHQAEPRIAGHIVGMKESAGVLPAKMPEQPLLCDLFSNPRTHVRLGAAPRSEERRVGKE